MNNTKSYKEKALEIQDANLNMPSRKVAKLVVEQLGLEADVDSVARNIRNWNKSRGFITEKSSQRVAAFQASAWGPSGTIMDIDEYCTTYDLPRDDVKTYKLVTHTATPYYNIAFHDKPGFTEDDFDALEELRKQLKGVKKFKSIKVKSKGRVGVITLTDLHFGAYVDGLKLTPEFNISILCDMLSRAAEETNRLGYSTVHVHLLGDLIESFTGLNHKNSWKGLDKGMFGVSAIKLFVELFIEHFLSKLNNLGSIKIVAGNHDRVTSSKDEDTDGGAAELISWGLDLLGYDVEFSTSVITHVVDDVAYILNHGHHGYTKSLSTQEMCWSYGVKGKYNFITEGHLHSRIQKLTAKQLKNFEMISDDTVDCRRQVCPSLFTGNSYSEFGGWTTCAGFIVSESNGKKGVNVFDFSL